jgi:ABC-type transport system involved in multi-copper enzyme maturation permease subunit
VLVSALTITRHTFQEAHRRWVMWAVVLMGVAFLGLYAIGLWLIQREFDRNVGIRTGEIFEAGDFFLLAGLYAVDFLVVVLAILVSVDTISGEIASGTIQTIVTRPIRRWEVVVGKWFGLAAMLGLWSVLMSAAVIVLSWWITGYVPQNPVQGVALIALAGIIALTISIAGGTRLSTLTNGVLVFMLYGLAFIGGWIEQFGALLRNQTSVNFGIWISLLMPSEAMWKRAAYLMEPPVLRQLGVHPFAAVSAPSVAMVVYALLFVLGVLGLAVALFSRRDL